MSLFGPSGRFFMGASKYVSAYLAERLGESLEAGSSGPPHEALSDREYEVLCKIASGQTVGQIAEGLHLSVKTISTYRSRILQKMRMSNNAELMAYALRHELVH